MNSQVAFLQWVKKNHPNVLRAAVQKVQRKVSFGGLGDDLMSDITFDPNTLSASDSINYDVSSSYNPAGTPSSSTDWSGIINSVAQAIPAVAGSVVQTQAQLALINANAQRASQGLPLLNSLTGSSGLSSASMPMILLLGVGIFALAAMAGKGGSTAKA